MLLLRPSPAMPKPSVVALTQCHQSACESIRLYNNLYRKNLLIHSWMTFHSLVLSTITLLYCIKVVPQIAQSTKVDHLMGDLSISLSILSATGEHWSGAKRSRDILDELGRSTVRWLQSLQPGQDQQSDTRSSTRQASQAGTEASLSQRISLSSLPGYTSLENDVDADLSINQNPFSEFLMDGSFAEYFDATESVNVDNIVRDLFQDFIPTHPGFT